MTSFSGREDAGIGATTSGAIYSYTLDDVGLFVSSLEGRVAISTKGEGAISTGIGATSTGEGTTSTGEGATSTGFGFSYSYGKSFP